MASEIPEPQPPQRKPDVIGRAFRRSLLVIGLGLALALSIYVLQRPPAPLPDPEALAPVASPVASGPAALQPPLVAFSHVTEESGIRFVHENGAQGDRLLPETMGSGAAFFDYDNDGHPDLLLVNGSRRATQADDAGASPPTLALYRNDGRGRFQDVTATAGLHVTLYGMGVAVGDYDNDGWVDVFITALGTNRLYRNQGGTFTDVTEAAGVGGAPDAWSTSAAFLDYDNDGHLDLYVANYVRWSPEIDFAVDFRLTGIGRAYGPPTAFEGTHGYLYRNGGDGRFADVSASAGIQVSNPATGRPMGKALGVVPVDLDGDGWMDLIVANDTVQNFFLRNRGDGTFEELGTLYGLAFDRAGAATGAMGIDAAHYRNDLEIGVAVGNFANEMSSLYVTHGAAGPLTDEAIGEGIGPPSRLALTFGLFFFDYDLDGRLDLLAANGHLESAINQVQASQHYAQPPQLFWNCGDACRGTFVPVPYEALGGLGTPLVGRGATYADIDGDGDLDILITQNGRRPLLVRNDQRLGHHWLRVKLVGHRSNRDAIGARVELTAGGITRVRTVMPSRSYLSQVELPVTFGLGHADRVDALRVHWPGGATREVAVPGVDRLLLVEEEAGATHP